MTRSILSLACLASLFALSTAQASDPKLEGKWTIVSLERDGKADDSMKDALREHSGDKYSMTPKSGKSFSGMMKVDPKAKTIDMTPSDGRYKDKTLLGIYELEGDTLKICFAEPGKDRPKELRSGPGVVLAVHKKVK